jgi:hypothetical protein
MKPDEHLLDLIIFKRQLYSYFKSIKYFFIVLCLCFLVYNNKIIIAKISNAYSATKNAAYQSYLTFIDRKFFALKKENLNIKISGSEMINRNILNDIIYKGNYIDLNVIREIKSKLNDNQLIQSYSIIRIKLTNTLLIKIKEHKVRALMQNSGNEDVLFFVLENNLNLLKIDNPEIYNLSNKIIIYNDNYSINEISNELKLIFNDKKFYELIKHIYILNHGRLNIKLKNNILIKMPFKIENNSIKTIFEILNKYDSDAVDSIDLRIKEKVYVIFND